MSYDTAERSNYDAQPVALYSFQVGPNSWDYVNGEEEVYLAGVTYLPTNITDNGETMSGEIATDEFVVSISKDANFVALFRATPPSAEITLIVRHWNRGEPDSPVVGTYLVKAAKRTDEVSWDIVCRAYTVSLNRNGLRLGYGRYCPHALYDHNCQVDPNAYKVTGSIISLTGTSFNVSGIVGQVANYFAGGYFEWEWLPGVIERRAIETSNGSLIAVMGTTDGLALGTSIALFPGCDRTTIMCNSRFSNILNFGGFPHMPGKNPFDGKPVF